MRKSVPWEDDLSEKQVPQIIKELRRLAKAERDTEYVCGVCGTRLLLLESGEGWVENLVCCEVPMKTKVSRKTKAKPKKKAKGKKRR
jgi:hypothetical protein